MLGLFNNMFDLNRDGKMDRFEKAAETAFFFSLMNAEEEEQKKRREKESKDYYDEW